MSMLIYIAVFLLAAAAAVIAAPLSPATAFLGAAFAAGVLLLQDAVRRDK